MPNLVHLHDCGETETRKDAFVPAPPSPTMASAPKRPLVLVIVLVLALGLGLGPGSGPGWPGASASVDLDLSPYHAQAASGGGEGCEAARGNVTLALLQLSATGDDARDLAAGWAACEAAAAHADLAIFPYAWSSEQAAGGCAAVVAEQALLSARIGEHATPWRGAGAGACCGVNARAPSGAPPTQCSLLCASRRVALRGVVLW